MGVQNLWELLAPVGRRVSVETLAGKRLAIDASIWMIQFMKAMRDEKGEMVRNAHILGFFRRICKLLFLRTKPVFVFDGGTPALKRRTVVARRRQRENAQAKIRKTAEKLLLNHLKTMRLKELADDLENQRQKNGGKGKKAVVDDTGKTEVGNEKLSQSYNQEAIDEMLAASLAAEGDGGFTGDASTSGAGILAEDEDEDEDGDEDEEMILPNLHGKVDPAVLAALPPSMQLDLLVQMRERLMAENRQKYQKVKKAPARFSELQIEAYLKTVAFRREISEVQKSAGGRGIGGVQTSRIASEANREFIFSSSFTGDRQVLASAGVQGNSKVESQTPKKLSSAICVDGAASTKKSNAETLSALDEPRRGIHEDVETYRDERGRVRVSKVRAMGIRMTRDLQRNLDLMKEIEHQREEPKSIANEKSNTDSAGVSTRLCGESNLREASYQSDNRNLDSNRRNDAIVPISGTSIEVSFEEDNEQKCGDSDDDIFAQIVAGDPVVSFSTDIKKQASDSASDIEWEEEAIEDIKGGSKPPLAGGSISDEGEVEWEEDSADIPKQDFVCRTECRNTDSKGALEEEADFQEALRRSIEDLQSQKAIHASSGSEKLKDDGNAGEFTSFGSLHLEEEKADTTLSLESTLQSNESLVKVVSGGVERLETVGEVNISTSDDPTPSQLAPPVDDDGYNMEVQIDKPCQSHLTFHAELSRKDLISGEENSLGENGRIEPVISIEEKGADLSKDVFMNSSSDIDEVLMCTKLGSGVDSHTSYSLTVDMPDVTLADAQQSGSRFAIDEESKTFPESKEVLAKEATGNTVKRFDEKVDTNAVSEERVVATDISHFTDRSKEEVEITGARLQEEMLNLTKERIDLGDEQRKLERNAESVSSEMFAECQELLQMFGLPYIIAPMEAEAQCAYMELENLVDGVVTDDSDVLLFGARSVYKNIFDDRKYVETYFMKDIENELGLTREKLIRMALLLGSDYTEGVSGIGIVNAVEVLTAFPEEDGLQKFREWIESPDPSILGQSGSTPRKKGSKSNADAVSGPNQSGDDIEKTKQIFMDKHRNVSKNWHIPSSFPSEAVISAYASPQVDKSTEPFSWGKPDLFILRKLCWEKFGWGTQKADELLQPVLKEYNKHETQLRLEAFYTFNERFAKIRSKRISKAVKGIAGSKSAELVDESGKDATKVRKKRKASHMEDEDDKEKEASRNTEGVVSRGDTNSVETSAEKHSRKSPILEESSEVSKSKPPLDEKVNTKKGTSVRGRGRGRRQRGRGRGRGQSVGGGRRKENSLEFGGSGTSSDDGNISNDEQERLAEQSEGSHEVRRSKRARKAVKYTVNDFDIENSEETNQDDQNSAFEDAKDEEPMKDEETSVRANDAVDPSGSNHHGTGDPLNEKGLPCDTLEMGGGFCMDEAELETSPLDWGQNEETLPTTEPSKEYLQMGGGFCLDEDEDEADHNDPGNASSPMRTPSFEDPNPLHGSDVVEEAENDTGVSELVHGAVNELKEPQVGEIMNASESSRDGCSADVSKGHDDSKLATSKEDVEEDASGTRPLLSAMPNLRRKRRKS